MNPSDEGRERSKIAVLSFSDTGSFILGKLRITSYRAVSCSFNSFFIVSDIS